MNHAARNAATPAHTSRRRIWSTSLFDGPTAATPPAAAAFDVPTAGVPTYLVAPAPPSPAGAFTAGGVGAVFTGSSAIPPPGFHYKAPSICRDQLRPFTTRARAQRAPHQLRQRGDELR